MSTYLLNKKNYKNLFLIRRFIWQQSGRLILVERCWRKRLGENGGEAKSGTTKRSHMNLDLIGLRGRLLLITYLGQTLRGVGASLTLRRKRHFPMRRLQVSSGYRKVRSSCLLEPSLPTPVSYPASALVSRSAAHLHTFFYYLENAIELRPFCFQKKKAWWTIEESFHLSPCHCERRVHIQTLLMLQRTQALRGHGVVFKWHDLQQVW